VSKPQFFLHLLVIETKKNDFIEAVHQT